MPTYEYRCPNEHRFELFQRMSDPPEAECPECGAAATRELSGGAGLLFKGSGFYITDYRNDSYKKAAEADSGGKKPDAAKSEPAKPETPKKEAPKSTPSKGGAE